MSRPESGYQMNDDIRPYEIYTLQPGFVVVEYDPAQVDPISLRCNSQEEWTEFEKRGYWGGIIIPKGARIDTLDDKLLADLGLQRIR